jgi:hypothetical protein
MRPDVPSGAVPAWERLRALLAQGELEALCELSSCTGCGDRAAEAQRALELLLIGASVTGSGPTDDDQAAVTPTATATAPAAGSTVDPTSVPDLPGVTVSVPPVTIGSATVGLPGVGITTTAVSGGGGGVTLPSATVSLPTLGVSSTVAIEGGGVTLPGVTLTGSTLSAPLDPTLP